MAKFESSAEKETRLEVIPDKETVEVGKETLQGTLNMIERFLGMIDKHGIKRIFEAILLVVLLVFLMIFAFNPGVVFKSYDNYKAKEHTEAMIERFKNTPLIQEALDKYRKEVNASRVAIFELHNSTNSLDGMPFLFGSLTYESLNPALISAANEFDNVRLSLYPIVTYLRQYGVWYGKVEDLKEIDAIAYQRLKLLNAGIAAFRLIRVDEIPDAIIVCIFNDGVEITNEEDAIQKGYELSYKVGGLLSLKNK